MKKYLMIGLAALAFASCSKNDFVTTTQADIDKAKYDQAFRNYIGGAPAANQDWGFGATITRAFTRASINVNGNQWKSCPTVGSTEDADVAAYVRALTTLPNTNPAQLQNYYVTQIHKGTETYTDLDNHSGILGSEKMNNLHIAMQSTATLDKSTGKLSGDWEHINNFNAGNCTDWSSGDGYGNTLVTGGGTFDFAYESAEDSKYHNRWIAIDGANVPKTGGGNYAGKYYVCFDFEATNDNVKTVFQVSQPGNNPGETFVDNVTVDGAWTVESAAAAGLTVTARGKEVTITTSNATVTQYVEGNKVVIGNDVYDDWIIRLVEATPKTDDPNYTIRVIGEDLTVNQDDELSLDFDFNDVVFDVALNVPGKTYIKVKAAGGTLPLIIGVANPDNAQSYDDNEVHHILGYSDTGIMINTNAASKGLRGASAADGILTLNTTYTNASQIPVFVKKNGVWCELTAIQGEPASKIGISNMNFRWCDERTSMKGTYPLFTQWVQATSEFRGSIVWW